MPEQSASVVEVEVMAGGTVTHQCIVNGVNVRCVQSGVHGQQQEELKNNISSSS